MPNKIKLSVFLQVMEPGSKIHIKKGDFSFDGTREDFLEGDYLQDCYIETFWYSRIYNAIFIEC